MKSHHIVLALSFALVAFGSFGAGYYLGFSKVTSVLVKSPKIMLEQFWKE